MFIALMPYVIEHVQCFKAFYIVNMFSVLKPNIIEHVQCFNALHQ